MLTKDLPQLTAKLEKIERRKLNDWEVVAYKIKPSQKVHPVVNRILNLRQLELDVQDWTNDFNTRFFNGDANRIKEILDDHARDEDKHDAILNFLFEYWDGTEDQEALELAELWRQDSSDVFFKKTMLESGVFFSALPLLREYSENDLYTTRIAQWILADETRHVASSRTLIKELGIKGNKSVIDLIERTIKYILKGEPESVIEYWLSNAKKTALTGKADGFASQSVRVVAAHFDQDRGRGELGNGYSNSY